VFIKTLTIKKGYFSITLQDDDDDDNEALITMNEWKCHLAL
jgi:hypothetical protein